jgi:hypothetical protein
VLDLSQDASLLLTQVLHFPAQEFQVNHTIVIRLVYGSLVLSSVVNLWLCVLIYTNFTTFQNYTQVGYRSLDKGFNIQVLR